MTQCCVPFCRHTTRRPFNEWVCGPHWRLVDKRVRSLCGRVKRKANRIGWTPALIALDIRLGAQAKRQAIERGLGI
jgi:hypothetical protein